MWVRGEKNALWTKEGAGRKWKKVSTSNPFRQFQTLFNKIRLRLGSDFQTGAFGALSYETGEFFERLPVSRKLKGKKYFEFIFPKQILVFYHRKRTITHTTLGFSSQNGHSNGLNRFRPRLTRRDTPNKKFKISKFKTQFRQKEFKAMVKRAKEYIRAGDIYQANLSQNFSFNFNGDPVAAYERLRTVNPSPFSSFVKFGKTTLISSSPELLLRKEGELCSTRPIAGTRPRGGSLKQDKKLSRSLLLSPKERAEHMMLVDLERNDLGRVCRFGTVKVDEHMVLERYSHVTHIVSHVVGEMAADKDAFDLIRALFPGGTITGCPKIRSMEIIHELEKKPRDYYTGSLGFLDVSGETVMNIIIRTICLEGTRGSIRVGAGIVADSNPGREYLETIHKAQAMFEALGISFKSQVARSR